MILNLKPRKCRRCKKEFKPKTEWQKFCSDRCRGGAANDKRLALIKRAKKIIQAHENSNEAA